MSKAEDFYISGQGDRLIDPLFYPKAISIFLKDEQKLLKSLISSFDLLIEVGCMHGRYLCWAVKYKKHYLGIDVVRRYITVGIQRISELRLSKDRYRFVRGGAEQIAALVKLDDRKINPENCVAFFPFNSFGNIPKPEPVVRSLKESGLPFLISSYRTSQKAMECRQGYYRNCGYRKIRRIVNKKGVRFISLDGLSTIAYSPFFFKRVI